MKEMDEADWLLRRISDERLLRAFASLTHHLHAVDHSQNPQRRTQALEVRSQRDRVQVEILRRMSER